MEVVSILVSMLPPFSSVWFWRESHLMSSLRTAAPGHCMRQCSQRHACHIVLCLLAKEST